MPLPTPPKVAAVEVVAAQPTEADSAALEHLSTLTEKALAPVVYIVKVELKTKLPATSMAWALYLDDVLIPKYWEYKDGIYFTVLDPEFFAAHKGKKLRFSQNGVDFHDTGVKLAAPAKAAAAPLAAKPKGKRTRLPTQAEVLR